MTQEGVAERSAALEPTGLDRARPVASPPGVLKSAALLFLAAVGALGYMLAFELTKPSPLSIAAPSDLVRVAGYIVLVAWLFTALALPVTLTLDRVFRRAVGVTAVTGIVYFASLLAFAENLLYTAQGVGLKTDDGPLLKLVFAVFAGSLATLTARAAARMTDPSGKRVTATAVVLGVLSLAVVAPSLRASERPSDLSAAATPRAYSVVILSSDGVDAERMSVYGYERETTPFLDSRSAEFSIFDNAFTNNGNTTGSITSMLSGRSPLETGVVYPPDALTAADARRTLPYLLRREGYYASNWAVPHYADGHDQNLVDAFDRDNGARDAANPVARLPLGAGPARWFVTSSIDTLGRLVADVANVKELSNPFSEVSHIVGNTLGDETKVASAITELTSHSRAFVNVHLMNTHAHEFRVEDPFFSRGKTQEGIWDRDFYDDAVRTFDSQIKRVYDALAETGELDRTILVVTSDHGIDYDPLARIPLLIRFPSAEHSGRHSVNVQRTDVAPTILDVLGYSQPRWMHGLSLAAVADIPEDREIVATTAGTRQFANQFGYRKRGDLVTTAIRCGTYLRVEPDGGMEQGRVRGSTSACDSTPSPPRAPPDL